jgi:hypothetical protein
MEARNLVSAKSNNSTSAAITLKTTETAAPVQTSYNIACLLLTESDISTPKFYKGTSISFYLDIPQNKYSLYGKHVVA